MSPFLRTQLYSIHRGRVHRQPGPSLCFPLQSMCALAWGPHDGRRQGLLHLMGTPLPHCRPSLSEEVQVFCLLELHLSHERWDKVSCDYTGSRLVFRGRHFLVRKDQSCLFHWQAGDPSPRCPLSQFLEESWQERLPQSFLDWAEGVSYAWGDPMNKCPLLLE